MAKSQVSLAPDTIFKTHIRHHPPSSTCSMYAKWFIYINLPHSLGKCWGNKIHTWSSHESFTTTTISMSLTNSSSKFHRVSRCCRPGATFTGERCVGFGVYSGTSWNFYMAINACQLLVQPNLPRNTSWILIWCSCFCEPLVLPRHDLPVTLNVLTEAVTRHLLWGTKNCLWVMLPPWAMTYLEIQQTDHLLHPITP